MANLDFECITYDWGVKDKTKAKELFGIETARKAMKFHREIPGYKMTPLRALPNLAHMLGVGGIYIKDEAERLEKKDIVLLTLKDLNVLREEAVLIGDSESDEKGAAASGVSFLAVSWGFGFPSGLANIRHVDRPEELLSIYEGVDMIEKIETKKAPAAIGPYSQAVKVNGMLFCSGQIPVDPESGAIVDDDVKAQARQVFKNIKAVLSEAGTDETKVIKATVFLKSMDDFAAVNEVYASFFEKCQILPARSAVAVQKLPKDVMVEIEVIALV